MCRTRRQTVPASGPVNARMEESGAVNAAEPVSAAIACRLQSAHPGLQPRLSALTGGAVGPGTGAPKALPTPHGRGQTGCSPSIDVRVLPGPVQSGHQAAA